MISDYYHRFQLAYAPFFVRKRVGKRFKVIARFRTNEQAVAHFSACLRAFLCEKACR
nr:MAG TPA: hypothetical protein [Microviridae sp.]